MAIGTMSSAKSALSLLREKDEAVILFALKRVASLMDTFWHEISADLSVIVELCEARHLSEETRRLASLVASHMYFHLGAYDDSVHYALAAGSAIGQADRSLFTDTILNRCIDQYVEYQEKPAEERGVVDPRLQELFTTLTLRWILQEEGLDEVKELVGFTIRACRMDFLEKVLRQYLSRTRSAEILNYTFEVANVLMSDISFRRVILRLLSILYTEGLATVDYFALAQCLLFLGDYEATANLLMQLLNDGNKMMAMQLAFDLFQYGNQQFISSLVAELNIGASPSKDANGNEDASGTAAAATGTGAHAKTKAQLLSVLTGEITTSLYLKFLYSRCAADVHVLNQIKKLIDTKLSLVHNATVIANSFMYCGTTIDGFLRDNMPWLGKAEAWAKFVAIASVGVIHRGHTSEAMKILEPYLPTSSLSALPYQEAGALYALGLIYAPLGVSQDRQVVEYLRSNLLSYSNDVQMVHGASLGLGLSAMGLQDEELYDAMFTCVTGSDAVGGEGAAVGIGMLMLGSGNDVALQSLLNVANEDNQKEKVIRGTSMAMALINMGRENEALPLANDLLEHGDPWLRLGGCFVLGLAYAGTENEVALSRLLNIVVKDTSDDVRRNAAMMIGFLTFKDPSLCVDLTRVLLDSYNPHVRYGVAMALAICGAGTAREDIVSILWDLKSDLVDYVRQGAYIALAIVLAQATEKTTPKVKEFRELLEAKIGDRKEDHCTKFGCILASGLIDAGGRNATYALHRMRHRLDKSVVGMFLFTQYWYWYPYALMISLSMQPTCFIGLNEDLEMPEYVFKSLAPPSQFAVPKSVLQAKKEVKTEGVQVVVLSTTRKEAERRQRRSTRAEAATETAAEAKETDATKQGTEEPEAKFELLKNPARVTAHQFSVISHEIDARFRPLKPDAQGVCLLRDTMPEIGPQKLIEAIVISDADVPPPEPFAYP